MERRTRSITADLLFAAGVVAWGVFVFSGGVYAGGDGRVRTVALPVAVAAVLLGVALVTASARAARR
jgi:hypothetical protein